METQSPIHSFIFSDLLSIKLFQILDKQASTSAGGNLFYGMHHSLQLKSLEIPIIDIHSIDSTYIFTKFLKTFNAHIL